MEKTIPEKARFLKKLKEAGFKVHVVNKATLAHLIVENENPDLVICDVIDPNVEGFRFCRECRQSRRGCRETRRKGNA